MLPFFCFTVVGDQEGVVTVGEVVYADIQPVLGLGRCYFHIPAGIPAEEDGHLIVIEAGIKVYLQLITGQIGHRITADRNRLPASGLQSDEGGHARLEPLALADDKFSAYIQHMTAVELGREPFTSV